MSLEADQTWRGTNPNEGTKFRYFGQSRYRLFPLTSAYFDDGMDAILLRNHAPADLGGSLFLEKGIEGERERKRQ